MAIEIHLHNRRVRRHRRKTKHRRRKKTKRAHRRKHARNTKKRRRRRHTRRRGGNGLENHIFNFLEAHKTSSFSSRNARARKSLAKHYAKKFEGYENLILGRLNVAANLPLTDEQRQAVAAAESHGSTTRYTDMTKLAAGVDLAPPREAAQAAPAPAVGHPLGEQGASGESDAAEAAPAPPPGVGHPLGASGESDAAQEAPANEHGVPVGAAAAGRQPATSAESDTAEAAPAPVVAQSVQGFRPKRFLHRPREVQPVPMGYFDKKEQGAERLSTALKAEGNDAIRETVEKILKSEKERLNASTDRETAIKARKELKQDIADYEALLRRFNEGKLYDKIGTTSSQQKATAEQIVDEAYQKIRRGSRWNHINHRLAEALENLHGKLENQYGHVAEIVIGRIDYTSQPFQLRRLHARRCPCIIWRQKS